MTADPRHIAARLVLLNALEVLDEHLNAVIVAGAQAVYLRTGHSDLGVAEFTTDGDLAIDLPKLGDVPLLGELMGRHFEQGLDHAGHDKPGVWVQMIEVEGESFEVPIDLIVPEGFAPPGGSRGARLKSHGRWAARKVTGLESALIDNDVLQIASLDPKDRREITCRVAGPTALLIAKAHKIQDRLDERSRTRVREKDAGDVYRLMLTTPPEVVRAVTERLLADPRVAESALRGMDLLRRQFQARRSPGVELAVQSPSGWRTGGPNSRTMRRVHSIDQLTVGHIS